MKDFSNKKYIFLKIFIIIYLNIFEYIYIIIK